MVVHNIKRYNYLPPYPPSPHIFGVKLDLFDSDAVEILKKEMDRKREALRMQDKFSDWKST